MADSLNYLRSKHGWAQTNRFVLRWFNLNEAPKAARETGMTSTVSRRPPISAKPKRSQRAALKTKRRSLAMGVTKKGTENEKGLDTVRNTEMQEHAAVTVNLISTRAVNSDEEMEEIGEDPEGEEREAAGGDDEENEDQDHSDVESFDFFTESSSEVSEEAVLLPNILIPCTRCHDVINICRLPCHRNLHCALQTLKYAQDQRPKNISALVRRRKLLIKQQQDASSKRRQDPFGDKHLHKLNTAFEFLRTELQGTTDLRYLSERVIEEIKVTGESFDLSCSIAAGVCEEANKRWKYMEDVHIYKDNFLNNINSAFFAIYDGYSGKTTALKCSRHLHVYLKEELDSIVTKTNTRPSKKEVSSAFRSSFAKTEKLLLMSEEERSQSRWSGCSAVTCVLTDDMCFIANAGNVGAILVRDNDVVKVLTNKHDLYNKKERERVKKSSGVIVKTEKCALINGALSVTRGIGNIGDMALKRCIINEPDVRTISLDPTDQLLVLASSGFWKMFSYEETIHLVNGFFGQIRRKAKQKIIEGEIVDRTVSEIHNEHLSNAEYRTKLFFKMAGDQFNDTSSPSVFPPDDVAGGLAHSKSEDNLSNLIAHYQINPFVEANRDTSSFNTKGEPIHTSHITDPPPIDDVSSIYTRHHRFSLPDFKMFNWLKGGEVKGLTRPEKARLLAKSLAERLVKSALYAESMDNITVFVALLPGFSMVNWQMVTPDILEALDEFMADDDLFE